MPVLALQRLKLLSLRNLDHQFPRPILVTLFSPSHEGDRLYGPCARVRADEQVLSHVRVTQYVVVPDLLKSHELYGKGFIYL